MGPLPSESYMKTFVCPLCNDTGEQPIIGSFTIPCKCKPTVLPGGKIFFIKEEVLFTHKVDLRKCRKVGPIIVGSEET